GADFDTLMRDADTAMYQAKRHGRNKFQFYNPGMHEQAVSLLALHNELRQAVERDEFVLHFQPLVRISSGAIVGAEALLRWNHPIDGMKLPGDFIGAAEDNGSIVPMGVWALQEACRQVRRWRDAGFDDLRVTVNV